MNNIGCQDGGKIRRLREQRSLGLTQFADTIGIGKSALSNIENGNKGAGIAVLIRIARGLGVTVDELVRDAGDDEPEAAAEAA